MNDEKMPPLPSCPWDLDLQCHCLTTEEVHSYAKAYSAIVMENERQKFLAIAYAVDMKANEKIKRTEIHEPSSAFQHGKLSLLNYMQSRLFLKD